MKDVEMFEEILTLNQKQEKTENQDNYIFRQIKLEKELNKIKKKIHADMSKDELRKLLPYEEFLTRALIDESDKEEDSNENESSFTNKSPLISPPAPQKDNKKSVDLLKNFKS